MAFQPKLAGVVVLLAVLTGCSATPSSPSGPSPQQQPDEGAIALSAEQEAALADGEVTHDEYEAGYRRYVDCLAASGYTVLDNGVEYDIHQFGVPAEAVESGDDDRCYSAEFKLIDVEWQIAHEDSSVTARLIADCLTAAGVAPKSTMAELNAQLEENGLTFEQCVQ